MADDTRLFLLLSSLIQARAVKEYFCVCAASMKDVVVEHGVCRLYF